MAIVREQNSYALQTSICSQASQILYSGNRSVHYEETEKIEMCVTFYATN